jgi:hypothetical protein
MCLWRVSVGREGAAWGGVGSTYKWGWHGSICATEEFKGTARAARAALHTIRRIWDGQQGKRRPPGFWPCAGRALRNLAAPTSAGQTDRGRAPGATRGREKG